MPLTIMKPESPKPLLRTKPRLKYCGLTLVFSNPSRFDVLNLCSGPAGTLMNNYCLRPDFNIMQCDLRVMEDDTPWLEGTKCILLLGEAAMHKYVPYTRNNTINEMRGSPLEINGIPAYASFFPQDAADTKNHEGNLNEQSKTYTGDADNHGDDDSDDGGEKSLSPTKRGNYAFWLKRDVWKCKQVLKGGVVYKTPTLPKSAHYIITPMEDEVVKILSTTKGRFLYFDIETDYEEQNLLCFAFSFGDGIVYSVPTLDYNYHWAYANLHRIMRALAIAIRDNTTVAHNGASFDFLVLAIKYRIPIGKTYDTMLAMHRCFPDIEKSLGHCTSYWTNERFHKDSDSEAYFTRQHMDDKLQYCAKDVWTMFLIHQEITTYARTIPGLEDSINCAMDSIRPYLITTIQGIRYSQEKVDVKKKENDGLMNQYVRMINLLIGDTALESCRKQIKGKAKMFPGSNTQCCHYFHDLLGYPVVARSPKTGKPSLAKKAMFKLALKYPNNPVIYLTLLYREVSKEYGALKFTPWKDDEGKIYKEPKEVKAVTDQSVFAAFSKYA